MKDDKYYHDLFSAENKREKKERLLTSKQLKEILHYDPKTGIFTWLKTRSIQVKPGDKAGSINRERYIQIRINKCVYITRRLAWLYMTGEWPKKHIINKNGDKTDDSWANLIEVDFREIRNKYSVRKDNSTGIKNVTYNKNLKCFYFKQTINGKQKLIFRTNTLKEMEERIAEYDKKRELSPIFKQEF